MLRKERLEVLCYALNSLSEKQGRRVEARILDGKKLKEVAEAEESPLMPSAIPY